MTRGLLPGDTADGRFDPRRLARYVASLVGFTPAGDLTDTDVQAALETLDVRTALDAWVDRIDDWIVERETFLGAGTNSNQIGKLGWQAVGNVRHGGGFGLGAQRSVHTSTSATGSGSIHLGVGAIDDAFVGGVSLRVTIPTLSTIGEEFDVWAGAHNGTAAEPTNGLYFEYDRNTSTAWRCVAAGGGTRTKSTSSPAQTVTAGQLDFLKIVCDGADAIFSINGTEVATISTNLPAAAEFYAPGNICILKSAGTTLREAHIHDWACAFEQTET